MSERDSKGRFVKGMTSWSKDKKLSEEHIRHLSESHKGQHSSPENEFKKGNKIRLGMYHSEKTKNKQSETKKRLFREGKLKPYWNGKTLSEEHKKKLSEKAKKRIGELNHFYGKKHTDESRRKMSKNLKEYWKTHEHPKPMLGKHTNNLNEEARRRIGEKNKINVKRLWQNPEYKIKQREKIAKALVKRPNNKELSIDSLIQSVFPNQYKLNLSPNITVINGRIPDWINCNGQKKCINFNGIYWHLWRLQKKNPNLTKEQIEEIERKPYKEFGFNLLIIWEDELRDKQQLIEKIIGFVNE